MYTIKQAAARAGVSVPLLRAWERRYGVVTPERTASRYRLYDEEDISRLRAMRRLLDDGWGASAAAASVKGMTPEEARALAGREPAAEVEADASVATRLIDSFVDAARRLDAVALETTLDQAWAGGSFEHVADSYLLPMMVAVGDAWHDGSLDVASEHAASHAMLRRLSAAFEAAGRPLPEERPILVGMPPGARHDLGALAFAIAARRAGLPVVYLGPDLPAADWVEAAATTGARAAVIGAVATGDVEPARRVASALRSAYGDLVVAFGGRPAAGRSAEGVTQLPRGLVAAVDALREALA